jgi:hypothetical protein
MKTKVNITNYLTKGSILVIIAVSLMINISAQKAQDLINSEKYASAQYIATEVNADNTKKLVSVASSTSANSEVSLEAFLMKAAGINLNVKAEEIEASEASGDNENSSLEQFLITAAGLNHAEISNTCENVSDSEKDLEDFLIHAASLDSVQDYNNISADSENESQDAGFADFLLRAAGLNMCNSSVMN